MHIVKSKSEFIADIRGLSNELKNLRLSAINVDRSNKSIKYEFICDKTVGEELKNKILKETEKITSPAFSLVTVSIKKIACDSELICNAIFRFINTNYPSVAIFLKTTDVCCSVEEDKVFYTIKLTKDSISYFNKNGVFKKINEHLGKNFCSEFVGSAEEKQEEQGVSLLTEEVFMSELEKIEHRTIKVNDLVIVDDLHMGNLAVYIEDIVEFGSYTVCGKVTSIREKETSKGKPMFVIYIDDTTGKLSGVYFSKKSTVQKIRDITEGECIIARVKYSEYDGKKSFTFEKINRCTFPKNFVKKEKFKKSAPKNYSLVFPEPATTIKVNTVFDVEGQIPEELASKEFVVFDIETTGLDLMSNGITEIGAVRVKNGKIVEHWTTLVKPDYRIDDENYKITGISNEMVKNSPKISQVLPDFMKFIDGTTLVAHNASFDMGFIKKYAMGEDYQVKNEVLDTLSLSRQYLPQLRRNDLQTLADYFGVVFHHHRALSDAYATAEILIELMKIKSEKDKMDKKY